MPTLAVRTATRDDCPTINAILNHYVEHSTATFITELQTLAERLEWFDARGPAHPVIVAEMAGQVVGRLVDVPRPCRL